MRQLTDGNAEVVLAQTYEPYGEVLSSAGEGESSYAYAGEWTDTTGLQYLRARYMNPALGRFTTRDTWAGDYNSPLSLNHWMYVQGNPVMYVDPSGYCGADWGIGSKRKTEMCNQMVSRIEAAYNIIVYWPERSSLPDSVSSEIKCFCLPGECSEDISVNVEYKKWKLNEVVALGASIVMYQNEMGSNALNKMLNSMFIVRGKGNMAPNGVRAAGYYNASGNFAGPQITLLDKHSFEFGDMVWVFTHEFAHQFTLLYADINLQRHMNETREDFRKVVWNDASDNPGTGPTEYARNNEIEEDIADSVTTYVWAMQANTWIDLMPPIDQYLYGNGRTDWEDLDESRIRWVSTLFKDIREMYP